MAALSVGPAEQRRGLLPGRGRPQPARVRGLRALADQPGRPHRDRLHPAGPGWRSGQRFERTPRRPDPRTRLDRSASARSRPRPVYFPITYVASDREVQRRAARLRPRPGPGPQRRSWNGPRDTGDAGLQPGHPAAGRRRRDQRLPRRLPRRGADRDRRRSGAAALVGFAAGSFRIGDLAAAATDAVDSDAPTCSCRSDETVVFGPDGSLDDAASAPLRIADRTWVLVVANPDGPGISLPLALAVMGLSLAALLGSLILTWSRNERMQELERAGEPGRADRPQEPAPLRGGPGGGDGAEPARRHHRGAADARPRPLQAGQRHPRPPGRRPPDQGDRRGAAPADPRERHPGPARRRRVRGDPAALQPRGGAARGRGDRRGDPRPPLRPAAPAPVTVSIGVAMFGDDPRTSVASVVSEADTAMYAAKDEGRDGVRIFDPRRGARRRVPEPGV